MPSGKNLLKIVISMFPTRKGTEVFCTCLFYMLECQVDTLVVSGVLESGLYQLLVACNLNGKM